MRLLFLLFFCTFIFFFFSSLPFLYPLAFVSLSFCNPFRSLPRDMPEIGYRRCEKPSKALYPESCNGSIDRERRLLPVLPGNRIKFSRGAIHNSIINPRGAREQGEQEVGDNTPAGCRFTVRGERRDVVPLLCTSRCQGNATDRYGPLRTALSQAAATVPT